ncbi:hypothetical protein TRFO_28632 [Tritrichomonas foetus]|uniref:TOG domain-containing protein n=1 Tax=Tritrichomonas foetus TaxID=1144522 RepID=A0A1J4K2L4_9EUKA|nr:hypothetical protein TRFO_28632 [Tritrichomonas foetus]|eukprot:OHT03974.1 hypothetical protein TRFO_28632 [Tritrichomonas foetus]
MRKVGVTSRSTPQGDSSQQQIERLFATAGVDVEGIEISTPGEALSEIEDLIQKIQNGNEWDDQVSAMRRGMALINGGALEYDCFVKNLSRLYDGLTSAASNMRSALVKTSCLFISQLARELGQQFEMCGDYITPLSPQLSNGTQIVANSCKYAILTISRHCPARRILASVIDLTLSRGASQKAVAAEALSVILSTWPPEAIGTNWPRLLVSLQKLLNDASPNVRVFARRSAKALQFISPQKSREFLAKLDQRTKKAISEEVDTINREPKVEIPKRRAPSAQPARKFKSVKQTKKDSDDQIRSPNRYIKDGDEDEENYRIKETRRDNIRTNKNVNNRESNNNFNENIRENGKGNNNYNVNYNHGSNKDSMRVRNIKKDNLKTREFAKEKGNVNSIKEKKKEENYFALYEGQERVFIGIVKEYIDDGNSKELSPHMKEIALNILKCCSNETPAISVSALAVLHDVLLLFPKHFEPNLPLVVNVLLDRAIHGCPRAVSNAEIILQELPQHYDVNELIKLLENQHPSSSLLHFSANLAEQNGVDYEDQSVCFCLMSNAAKCAENNIKSQQIAARMIGRVFAENEDAFNAYTDTLNSSELFALQALVKPYFPTIEFQQPVIDVPQYNTKSARASLYEIQKVIETADEGREWNSARPRIYSELNQAMMQKSEVDTALIIAQKTLHLRGFEDFERMFPGIIFNARGQYSRIAEISLTMILHSVDLESLLRALQSNIKSENIIIAKNTLDYQTKIISTVSKLAVKPLMSILIPTLVETLKSKAPEIRKATVLCYVELCVVMGSEMDQYIKQLEKPQQKLITIFLARRSGK